MQQLGAYKFTLCTLLILGTFVVTLMAFESWEKAEKWDRETPVAEVLQGLGDERPLHAVDSIDPQLVKKGEALVKKGRTRKPNGRMTSRQSRHYVCTDCHTTQPETPDLKYNDPEAGLAYAMEKDLPFLPGTSLYGVVNRESWYNGDYQKKYGRLALDARDTLRNAIQLCATECSQGRAYTDWELKAVLHYLWSLQLKLGDLNLDQAFIRELNQVKGQSDKQPELIQKLKSQYGNRAPATFADALPANERGFGKNGDAEKGRFIYENGCRHCHYSGGPPNLTLDYSVLTFNKLARDFPKYNEHSIYQVVRYGTSPKKGYKPYMPQYPLEKMSRTQMEHLAAFIQQESKPTLFDKLFQTKNQ